MLTGAAGRRDGPGLEHLEDGWSGNHGPFGLKTFEAEERADGYGRDRSSAGRMPSADGAVGSAVMT